MQHVEVESRKVDPGYPYLIIAEVGVNHNGDLGLARRLIDLAIEGCNILF